MNGLFQPLGAKWRRTAPRPLIENRPRATALQRSSDILVVGDWNAGSGPKREARLVGTPRRGVRLVGSGTADAAENNRAPRRCAPTDETLARGLSPVGTPRRGVRLIGLGTLGHPKPAVRLRSFSLRIGLLAFFLPFAHLAAKEKEPVITPSFAKPVQATIFLGGTVEIPLLANAPVHGMKYLLRSQPRKGQLEEIMTTDSGLASVVYRNDSGSGTGTDTFSYAVQSPGAAVSTRATVTVKVINRPPQLVAPEETDFGNVPVGSTVRRVVALSNSGGEPFISQIQLSSPWGCQVGRLEIPPGKSKDVILEFSPDVARTFSGEWFLAGAGGTGIRLTGTGYVVFDVSPSFLKLQEFTTAGRS